jgi:hypothetical protein
VETIQNQIKKLSAEELTRLRSWFADFDFTVWDLQIESDAKSGKLDGLAEKALQDHAAGRSVSLPPTAGA